MYIYRRCTLKGEARNRGTRLSVPGEKANSVVYPCDYITTVYTWPLELWTLQYYHYVIVQRYRVHSR